MPDGTTATPDAPRIGDTVGRVELRILGPLAVHDGAGEVGIGGARPRGLLARLLLARGQAVPLDTLVSAIWDGEPPFTARQQIHKAVSEVRRGAGEAIAGTPGPDRRGASAR